jgi:hypothetical protein
MLEAAEEAGQDAAADEERRLETGPPPLARPLGVEPPHRPGEEDRPPRPHRALDWLALCAWFRDLAAAAAGADGVLNSDRPASWRAPGLDRGRGPPSTRCSRRDGDFASTCRELAGALWRLASTLAG